MNNNIKNIINGITATAIMEAKMVKAIAYRIPQAENIRTWTSFDEDTRVIVPSRTVGIPDIKVSGIHKDIHWEFDFLGHKCELHSVESGKIILALDDVKAEEYFWSATNGDFTSRRLKDESNRWELYIINQIHRAIFDITKKATKKYTLAKEMRYGEYKIVAAGGEIWCVKGERTIGRIVNTWHGDPIIDNTFPTEIRQMLSK
jgi:hypothetical protein